MAKPDSKALRKQFDDLMAEIWDKWDEKEMPEDEEEEAGDSPFDGTYWMEFTNLDDGERDSFKIDMGWLRGVSDATGWELRRPGPREWSPRDR